MSEPSKLLCTHCKHSFVTISDRVMALLNFSLKPSRYAYMCKKSLKNDSEEFHVVDGPVKVKRHYENCAGTRLRSGVCGPEGSLWEPKHKKDLFLMLTEK